MRREQDPEKRDPKKVAAGHLGGTAKAAVPEDQRVGWKQGGPGFITASQQAQNIAKGKRGRMAGVKPGADPSRWRDGIGPKGSKWNPRVKRPMPGSKTGIPKNQFFHVTLMSYKTLEKNRNRLKGNRVRPKSDPEWSPLPFTIDEFRAEVLRQSVAHSEARGWEDARWVCPYTGKNFGLDEFAADHMIPRSRGGPDELSNLVICRKVANKAKGSLTAKEFEEILIPMRAWNDPKRMEETLRQWSRGSAVFAQKLYMRSKAAKAAKAGGAA